MHVELRKDNPLPFNGIILYTCFNITSVISESHHMSYCTEFGLRPIITPVGDRKVIGVGSAITAIGTVKLQIPFKYSYLPLDVHVLVFKEPVPTFLSMQYSIVNGMDISIQKHLITFRIRRQRLSLEKVF